MCIKNYRFIIFFNGRICGNTSFEGNSYIFELHAEYIYPLEMKLKMPHTCSIAAFPCKTYFSIQHRKILPSQTFKSATKTRKELPVRHGAALNIILKSQTFSPSHET